MPLRVVVIVADPPTVVVTPKNAQRSGSEPAVGGVVAVRDKDDDDVDASGIPSTSSSLRAAYTSAAADHVLSDPSSLIQSIERAMTSNAPHAFGTVRSV